MTNTPEAAKRVAMLYAVALACTGCAQASVVGTSGAAPTADDAPAQGTPEGTPQVGSKPQPVMKTTTGIVPEPNHRIYGSRVLGDIDDDGYDDFVVVGEQGVDQGGLGGALETAVHLFYGRSAFPAQLSTASADATFTACVVHPIGDVNGDGFADMSFTDQRGTRLVFGSPERIENLADLERHAPVSWDGETDPSKTLEVWANRAGDVNGDGFDDLLIWYYAREYDDRSGVDTDTSAMFLVWGRADGWPLGRLEPSKADAMLSGPDDEHAYYMQPTSPGASPDLDGDGYADIIATSRSGYSLAAFYGGPDRFPKDSRGLQPDVQWRTPGGIIMPIGDLDADGFVDLASFQEGDEGVARGNMAVHYGGPTRWTGRVELEPDLELTSTEALAATAASGDIDGDAIPDIIVQAPFFGEPQQTGALLVARGIGGRLSGQRAIERDDVLMVPPPVTPGSSTRGDFPTALFGAELDASGDIDGDGSRDVLIGAPALTGPNHTFGEGAAYLIPSTPGAPQ